MDVESKCPKCGQKKLGEPRYRRSWGREYLHRGCYGCGYQHKEPCKDAAQPAPAGLPKARVLP